MPRLTEKDLETAEERLRDAAEDLLAALKAMLAKPNGLIPPEAYEKARAAIAKAEGREP